MVPLSRERKRVLLSIHGWTAVALGLLVYVVIVTGAVAVFAEEIADWSSPLPAPPTAELPAGLDGVLRDLADRVDPAHREEMVAFRHAGGRLTVFFHTHGVRPDSGEVEEIGTVFDLDPAGFEILDRREGWAEDIERANVPAALGGFLATLHATLLIPGPWGLLFVGASGLALMIAALTGFFVHRHLLRELFTLRGRTRPALAARDAHAVAGSWILPFALLFGFTGAYFAYAGTIGFPATAAVATGGDEALLFETLVGVTSGEDRRPRPMADLDAMIADAGVRSGAAPNFLVVDGWGRADSTVTIFTELPQGDLVGLNYVYDGASGALRHEKPSFGPVLSAGGALLDLVDWLHFGNFAGVTARVVWFCLGFLGAHVVLSGLKLWCERRRESRVWRGLARTTCGVGHGLPFVLAAIPYGYFPARAAGVADTQAFMAASLLLGAIVAAGAAFALRKLSVLERVLPGLTGALLAGLPLLRMGSGGPGWAEAVDAGLHTVLAVDLALAAGGVAFLLRAARPARQAESGRVHAPAGRALVEKRE